MNQKQKTIVETAAQELSVLMGKLPRRYACHFIVDDLSIPSEANKKNCNLTVFSIAQHIGLTTAYVQGSPSETIKNLSAHTNSPACGIAQIGHFSDFSKLDSSVLFRFKTDEDFEVILLTLNQELVNKVLFEVSSSRTEVKLTPVKPIFFDFTKKTTVPLVPVDIASLEDLKGNEVLDKISRMKKTKIDIVSDGVSYEGVNSVIHQVLQVFNIWPTHLDGVIGMPGNDHVSYKAQAVIAYADQYSELKDEIKALGFEKIVRVITREDILNGVVPSSKQCIYIADNQMLESVTSVFPLLKEVEKVSRVVEIMKHRRGVLTVKVEPEPCEFTVSEERESMAAASISNKTLSWPDVVKDHKKLLVKSQNENFDLHSIGDLNITASQEHKDMFTNLESIANARQCLGTMNLKANIQSLAEAAKETAELNNPVEVTTESTTDSPTPEKGENKMKQEFKVTVRMPYFTQRLLVGRVSKDARAIYPMTYHEVLDTTEGKKDLLKSIFASYDKIESLCVDASTFSYRKYALEESIRKMELAGICDDLLVVHAGFFKSMHDFAPTAFFTPGAVERIKKSNYLKVESIENTTIGFEFTISGGTTDPVERTDDWMHNDEKDMYADVTVLRKFLTEQLNSAVKVRTEVPTTMVNPDSTTDSPTPVKEETMNTNTDPYGGLKYTNGPDIAEMAKKEGEAFKAVIMGVDKPNEDTAMYKPFDYKAHEADFDGDSNGVVEIKIPDNSKPPMKDSNMNHTFEFTVRMPAFTQWLLHARVSKGAYMRVPATTFTGVMDMSEEKMKLLVDILHRHDNDAKATLIELHKTRAMETTGVCDDVGMLKDMFADKLKDSGVLSDCPLDVSGEIKAVKFIVIKSIKETDGVYTFDLVGYRNCPDQNMTGWMEVKEHDVFVKVDELIALLNKQDIERSKESMSSGLEAKKAEDQTDLETLIAETAYRVDGQCKAAINQSLNDIRTYTKAMNLKRDENFITFSNTRKTLVRRCAMIKQRLDADDASLSAVVVVHLVNDLVSLSSQVEKDGAVYKQIDFLVSHIKNSYKFGIENERQAPVLMHTDEYGAVKTLVLLESLLFVIA